MLLSLDGGQWTLEYYFQFWAQAFTTRKTGIVLVDGG